MSGFDQWMSDANHWMLSANEKFGQLSSEQLSLGSLSGAAQQGVGGLQGGNLNQAQTQQNVSGVDVDGYWRRRELQRLREQLSYVAELNAQYKDMLVQMQSAALKTIPVSMKPIKPLVQVTVDQWDIERVE